MNNNQNLSNDRLLKILITIGIIAILILVCIEPIYTKYINPYIYIIELLKPKEDQSRIQNLSSINSALNELQNINSNLYLGESNKLYISLPSSDMKCGDLELPSLPDNWEYRCKSKADYRKIDGDGWIPVDFTKISSNLSFESLLPKDPVNTSVNGFYYTYIVGEKDWALVSLLESNKFLQQYALIDGGTDPIRYEIGSNPKLWAQVTKLKGYWKFDEGEETTATDSSGKNNTGTFTNGPVWVDGQAGKALSFDGTDDYIDCGDKTDFEFGAGVSFTLMAWYKGTWSENTVNGLITKGYHSTVIASPIYLMYLADSATYGSGIPGDIRVGLIMTDATDASVIDPASPHSTTNVGDGNWHHLVVVVNKTTDEAYIYVDGSLEATGTITSDVAEGVNANSLVLMNHYNRYTLGTIDEVRIYNRALKAKEVNAMYNVAKINRFFKFY